MDRRKILTAFAIAGLLTGIILGGAVIKDGSPFGATVASWTQALGAIWAVVASAALAITIDLNAAARLRRDRADETAAHYTAGRDALTSARGRVTRVRKAMDAAKDDSAAFSKARTYADEVTIAIEVLDHYRARGALRPGLVYAIIGVRKQMLELLTALQNYNSSGGAWAILATALDDAERQIHETLKQLDDGVLEPGALD